MIKKIADSLLVLGFIGIIIPVSFVFLDPNMSLDRAVLMLLIFATGIILFITAGTTVAYRLVLGSKNKQVAGNTQTQIKNSISKRNLITGLGLFFVVCCLSYFFVNFL